MLRHCLLLALALPSVSWGCERWSDDLRNDASLTVGSISIDVNDVFDPNDANENELVHQLANRFHIESRESLIRAQLLFEQRDRFDFDLLAETERNLRRNSYLRSATVTPIQVCEGEVDILVTTGDNWSLVPGVDFSRAGGENEFEISLAELNLLGLGKNIGFKLDFGRVRDQRVLQYFDPMLFGSKTQLELELQNNTDGEVQILSLRQPFGSLDARSSWRVDVSNLEFVQSLYQDGRLVDQLNVDRERLSARRGFSTGRKLVRTKEDGSPVFRIMRFSAGWQYEQLGLAPAINPAVSKPVPERVFSYPFLEFSLLQPTFIEQSNLQVMESVEDVNVGHTLRTRIGLSTEAFGSSENTLRAELNYGRGWQIGNRFLGLFNTSFAGYYSEDGIEDGLASATLEGFYFFSNKNRFFASLEGVGTTNLFENRQLVLGGETGLRGYPLFFQTGTRRAKLTLEQRYFFDWYPLRLARVGSAAFFDAGSAWEDGESPDILTDVGFGLRIVGTRQANTKVLHIDFAFPLNETDRIDGFQLVVKAKTQF